MPQSWRVNLNDNNSPRYDEGNVIRQSLEHLGSNSTCCTGRHSWWVIRVAESPIWCGIFQQVLSYFRDSSRGSWSLTRTRSASLPRKWITLHAILGIPLHHSSNLVPLPRLCIQQQLKVVLEWNASEHCNIHCVRKPNLLTRLIFTKGKLIPLRNKSVKKWQLFLLFKDMPVYLCLSGLQESTQEAASPCVYWSSCVHPKPCYWCHPQSISHDISKGDTVGMCIP